MSTAAANKAVHILHIICNNVSAYLSTSMYVFNAKHCAGIIILNSCGINNV